MNENIDLTKILKDCPKGTKFYHLIYNEVYFVRINEDRNHPIYFSFHPNDLPSINVSKDGKHIEHFDGECIIFPSKEQRDWSKFNAPWYKKEKFDPKTLKPFDKVLARDDSNCYWYIEFFSHYIKNDTYPYKCSISNYKLCVPYNDDTKHLIGTNGEAPDYYRYWED